MANQTPFKQRDDPQSNNVYKYTLLITQMQPYITVTSRPDMWIVFSLIYWSDEWTGFDFESHLTHLLHSPWPLMIMIKWVMSHEDNKWCLLLLINLCDLSSPSQMRNSRPWLWFSFFFVHSFPFPLISTPHKQSYRSSPNAICTSFQYLKVHTIDSEIQRRRTGATHQQ